jgi:hypothetical protein
MADVKATRLRFISAKTASELSGAVSALPFKVEMKEIVKDDRWYAWFVIPDHVPEFNNIEV